MFLRVEHDTAEPQVVTAALGIAPTSVGHRGDLLRAGDPLLCSVWVLSSAWVVHSKDVAAHFRWLLAHIEPRSSTLRDLRGRGFRMEIHCLWVGAGGYGGPELTADTLQSLANLGLDLCFDIGVTRRGQTEAGGGVDVDGVRP